MFTVPTTKLFRRGKDNERKDDKYDRTLANTMGGSNGGNMNLLGGGSDLKGNNLFRKLEDALYIHTKPENPNGLNFQELYQENLPPEARELDDYVKKFKDKDTSKDKEIQKY